MKSFLRKEAPVNITIVASVPREAADQVANDLTTICANCSPEELSLLARAVRRPVLKIAAVNELKKRLK